MSEFEKWCKLRGKNPKDFAYYISVKEAFEAGHKSGLLKAVDIGEQRKLAVKPYFETMAAIHKAAKEVER